MGCGKEMWGGEGTGKRREEEGKGQELRRRAERRVEDRREERGEGRARDKESERRESLAVTNFALASTYQASAETFLGTVKAYFWGSSAN